jgi:hypothetical protein
MEVTTDINLLQLVSITAEKEMGCADAKYSKEEFASLIGKIFQEINLFSRWSPVLSKGWLHFVTNTPPIFLLEEVKELFEDEESSDGEEDSSDSSDGNVDRSDDEVLAFHKGTVSWIKSYQFIICTK